jgi:hypothetical protein
LADSYFGRIAVNFFNLFRDSCIKNQRGIKFTNHGCESIPNHHAW